MAQRGGVSIAHEQVGTLGPLALASLKLGMGVAWPPTCPAVEPGAVLGRRGHHITRADGSPWPWLGPSTQVGEG